MTTLTVPTDLHVKVTQDHIDGGKRRDFADCPIAVAVREALNGEFSVEAFAHQVVVWDGSHFLTALLPECATDFIFLYDVGHAPGPIEFDLAFKPCMCAACAGGLPS